MSMSLEASFDGLSHGLAKDLRCRFVGVLMRYFPSKSLTSGRQGRLRPKKYLIWYDGPGANRRQIVSS
jgi:hypothetical protein